MFIRIMLVLGILTWGAIAEASKPGDLKAEKVKKLFNYPLDIECMTKPAEELREINDYRQMGELLWVTSCNDKDLNFAPVSIAYFKAATFLNEEKKLNFNKGIAEYNEKIEKLIQKGKERIDPAWSQEQKDAHLAGLEKIKDESRRYVPARPFKTKDGREGYSFVTGFGPGGSMLGSALTSKNKQYDIFVQIFFPSDGSSLKKTDATAAYYDRITINYFDVLESVVSELYKN